METNIIITWAIVSFILSFGISIFLTGYENWKLNDFAKRIGISFLATFLILIVRFGYTAAKDYVRLTEIEQRLTKIDSTLGTISFDQDCSKALSIIRYGTTNDFYSEVVKTIYGDLLIKFNKINEGRITLTPSEVKTTWTIIVGLSKDYVYATNTIAPDDWPLDACKVQKNIIGEIKRVMVFRNDDDQFNNSLRNLGIRQLKECKVKSVQWIFVKQLYDREKEYFPFIQKLGFIDLVLVDDKVLLLTNYDENTKNIRQGILTTNPEEIRLAKELFKLLFS